MLCFERSSFEFHNPPTTAAFGPSAAPEVPAVSTMKHPTKSTSGNNVPPCHVPAASGCSEDSDQRRILPHEHLRQGILRRDQPEGPERQGFSALVDNRHQPGRFRAGRSSAAYSPKVAAFVSGEPPPASGGEQCGQRIARTSTRPKISG